jgi:diguanylate cyclase (GGDEF)-like protein
MTKMTKNTHKDKARQLLNEGFNCAQAMVGAFAEDYGYDKDKVMRLTTCFCSGTHKDETCGCSETARMICGMTYDDYVDEDTPQDNESNIRSNEMYKEFLTRFSDKMEGRILCRELLGYDISTSEGVANVHLERLKKKICPTVLDLAIETLDTIIEEYNMNNDYIYGKREETEKPVVLKRADKVYNFRKNINDTLLTSDRNIAFIQFDIKRFKIINDHFGERFGDEVLFYIDERLKELCRDDKLYIHSRSDVFTVATGYDSRQEILDLVSKIEKEIHSYKSVRLQLVFGIYYVEDKSMEVRQMEDRAAMARKSAKAYAITNIEVYQQQYKDNLYVRKFIEDYMQTAISEKQFKMYVQPKYNIVTNKIVGAEALVRWVNPDRGIIYPNEFVPVMEENGFIKKVDYYIWEKTCQFINKCAEVGIYDCPISVNVSRHHLKNTLFIDELSKDIDENGINRSLLQLEITETANDQNVSNMANILKAEGFTLLMDDFGSGYSSLNVLLETPFDILKLDKKFVDNMITSKKGKIILEYMVSMANAMGLGLIAEGVETAEQVDLLKKIGCNEVQGYYYAKPMPEEDFFELLKGDRQGSHNSFAIA